MYRPLTDNGPGTRAAPPSVPHRDEISNHNEKKESTESVARGRPTHFTLPFVPRSHRKNGEPTLDPIFGSMIIGESVGHDPLLLMTVG